MKRTRLLRQLRRHGCHLKREGASHSLLTNPASGVVVKAIPRHADIPDMLARKICPRLSVPEP